MANFVIKPKGLREEPLTLYSNPDFPYQFESEVDREGLILGTDVEPCQEGYDISRT